MSALRVAIVGLGYFSAFHIAAWQAQSGVEITAATDPDAVRRDWAAREYGLPVCEDLGAVLATSPDVVDIVAPPPAHAAILRAAMAPNRVLICQKPFCTSLAEAQAVIAQAEAIGARIIIHENFRFQPWHRAIKSVLDAGTLGQVYAARFDLRPGDGRGPDAYLARQPAFQTMPRLLIHETGVHFIDLFRWMFGEITDVYADLRRLNPAIAGEDAGILMLSHDSGVQSVFDGNRLADHITDAPRRTMGEMAVEGEGGTLRLDGQGRVWLRRFGAQDETPVPLPFAPDDSFGGGCVAALISHVAAAMRGGGAFENEARDYLPVIAAADLAYRSAEQGRKLTMPNLEG